MKGMAKTSNMHTHNIASSVVSTSESWENYLLRNYLYREIAQVILDFNVTLNLTKTIDGQPFLTFHSGKEDENRMLIFANNRCLNIMSNR